jgi:hypothetical protein
MSDETPIPDEAVERFLAEVPIETTSPSVGLLVGMKRGLEAAAPLIVAANRLVLPEPMSRDDDRDPIAWEPEGIDGQVSAHPDEGEVDFEYWSWSPAAARALAVSLLAAADYVEFQASELRKEGQADG